jgi:hypothetical protein
LRGRALRFCGMPDTPRNTVDNWDACAQVVSDSTVVFWPTIDASLSRHDRLLLGKQRGKERFRPLSELELLMGIQDQRLHECWRLLATRFPDGFEGEIPCVGDEGRQSRCKNA